MHTLHIVLMWKISRISFGGISEMELEDLYAYNIFESSKSLLKTLLNLCLISTSGIWGSCSVYLQVNNIIIVLLSLLM